MKTILAWVVVAVLAATSCATLRDVVWPVAVKCLATPSAAVIERVKAIVERDGLAGAFSAETLQALDNAAREYGPDVIACVLRELLDGYTKPTGEEAPPDQLAAARRIQAFYIQHDIEAVR